MYVPIFYLPICIERETALIQDMDKLGNSHFSGECGSEGLRRRIDLDEHIPT